VSIAAFPRHFTRPPFEIDHIIARQHGGGTLLSNLALSCLHCNAHKGPNIAGLDPLTRKLTKLFHPRPIGRVTLVVLAMNDPEAVWAREELIAEGVFPRTPPRPVHE